ncbi:MAG TPA: glycosyltransferase [Candidatus Saccharimonadia bacterium]|jgi:dolichyl-phosphate beta-glucosyltransferase|nr:glycosyltransferase [Candidatus Saccharimonadia bacterium]
MSGGRPDLSIIIPAYNEAARIVATLKTLAGFLDSRSYGIVEVVIVVADSPDGTAQLATAQKHLFKHFKLVEPGIRVGKGRDVRAGMFEASGRYKLFMDADLATPLTHLDDVHAFMRQDGQVAIAVRDLFVVHKSLVRKLMSKAANLAAQILATPGIKDTQCGFKVFEAGVADALFSRMTMLQWSFDMELLAIARQLGYKIQTIEVPDWSDPKEHDDGLAGDSIIKVALTGFLDPFSIRMGIWTGRYRHAHYRHQEG